LIAVTEIEQPERDDPGEPDVRVLLIDDDVAVSKALIRSLAPRGFTLTVFDDPARGLAHLASHLDDLDVILLDVDMPGMSGLEVLERIRHLEGACPVVMWTADSTALTATMAMRAGAFSYATKPILRLDEFVALLHSAASFGKLKRHAAGLERRVADAERLVRTVGESRVMAALQGRIEKLAQTDITILILGESGTGKELVARSIHELSARRRKPFVAINCGAISESMIDSELFGHSRGAFTGAVASRQGVFVEANGGTLFLDEVAELPLAAQTRLLRVLQEGEVRVVGGDGVIHVDVRVLAATHTSLIDAVAQKRFRADLYYRLDVATIEVPPLRARMTDIPALAAHFLRKHGGGRGAHLTPAALDALLHYGWPGNIRELENALLHALALSSGNAIDELALPRRLLAPEGADTPSTLPGLPDDLEWAADLSLQDAKHRSQEDFSRRYVTRALERAHGNLTVAAQKSGLDRSNFRRVLQRLGVDADLFRD
jgi:DNA-binding NtrC family response regulator